MNSVHFIMQGKGGVGKSFVAMLLAQYFMNKGSALVCADTDPVNATFTQYKSLNVAHVDIAKNGRVMQEMFDPLIEKIATTDADFIIDNGAATFLPLTNYMANNDIFDLLAENGKKVFVHNVITAGQAKSDTLNGFEQLASKVNGSAKIVVWENEYWGPIDVDGYPLSALKIFKQNRDKIAGTVKIVHRDTDDFISAIKKMTEAHMTYNGVLESDQFTLVAKSRIYKVVMQVFEELDKVEW